MNQIECYFRRVLTIFSRRIGYDDSLIFIKAFVDGFSHQNNENSIVGTGLSTIVVPSKKIR